MDTIQKLNDLKYIMENITSYRDDTQFAVEILDDIFKQTVEINLTIELCICNVIKRICKAYEEYNGENISNTEEPLVITEFKFITKDHRVSEILKKYNILEKIEWEKKL